VVKASILAFVLVVTAAPAFAQQNAQQPTQEMIRARQKISLVEGALERAVVNGASNFARQLQAVAPGADGSALLLGSPVVRGFTLEKGGVFFDVLMPSLQLSMVWPLRYTNQDVDARRRGGPATPTALAASPLQAPAGPAVSPDVDLSILDAPDETWRREVRATLTDAMIENSGSVTVKADETIVVSARASMSTDRMPDPGDARTIELTLKGSDLQAFRNQTISLEEARKRVTVREY
jgi:hypothetical protein